MDWDKLKIFHNVALDLNISEAANKMNISHSSISRQISSLERDLKVSLFQRHARGLSLTEQGKILFKTVHDIFGKIALTEAQLTDSKEKPTEAHRVFEGFEAGDGTRQDAVVVLFVVPLAQVDRETACFKEQALAIGMGRQGRSIARQRQAEGFGQAVHRIGGEHTAA